MNHGAFDGGLLNDNEKQLRHFYRQVMNFSLEHSSMTREYRDLHQINNLSDSVYAFLRFDHKELTIVAENFSQHATESIHLKVPNDVIQKLKIADDNYLLDEHIECVHQQVFTVENSIGNFNLELKPIVSLVWVLSLNQ